MKAVQRGFGLLEAIVALALFAGAGMALFTWINNSIAQAVRLQQSEVETRLQATGTEWVRALDLAKAPAGDVALAPGIRLVWRATPLSPPTPAAPFPGATESLSHVVLYRVDVLATDLESGAELRFSQRRLGSAGVGMVQELLPE